MDIYNLIMEVMVRAKLKLDFKIYGYKKIPIICANLNFGHPYQH